MSEMLVRLEARMRRMARTTPYWSMLTSFSSQ